MRSGVRNSAMTSALAENFHDRFSRLSRQLRSMGLPRGMTPERLSVLSTIQAREPISVTALADCEKVRPATMSRMISSLAADGYVRRLSDKSDGRGVLVAVTAKGKKAFVRAQQERLRQLAAALEELPADQLATIQELTVALEKLTRILGTPK